LLPVDSVVTNSFDPKPDIIKVVEGDIPDGFQGVDIGPKTEALYKEAIARPRWSSGMARWASLSSRNSREGTKAICEGIKGIEGKAFTVCGGGDSASAVKQFGYKKDFSHVSPPAAAPRSR
jgi:phosphoglycerate kinase